MSTVFRELLKKVGSGPHTSEHLSRSEAAQALRMMLVQEATPAQIGAFLMAHRIKRPTGEELAGMLDTYDELGPKFASLETDQEVVVLGNPYDGRSRTAPISPITALVLATAGCKVILHGGHQMPSKYGIPLIEIWQGLGVDFSVLTLPQAQQVLEKTGLGFIYIPQHFPLATGLVPYRDQIGKRPPVATLELIWCPYAGQAKVIAGYVHPPTEGMFTGAMETRGFPAQLTTVKGLEGSCDLPRDRTAIIGIHKLKEMADGTPTVERLMLHPHDYGFAGKEVPLPTTPQLIEALKSVLAGQPSEYLQAALWNAGFYLWHCGCVSDLNQGFAQAETLFQQKKVAEKLQEVSQTVSDLVVSVVN